MAPLSNPRIDFAPRLGVVWGMRVYLCLPLCALTACASFPQVDAAVSKTIAPRPALLTFGQINALRAQSTDEIENTGPIVGDLAPRADILRSR